MVWRFAALFFYITLALNAAQDDNISERTFSQYIDEKQKNFSKTVTDLFKTVDGGISGWIDDSDENMTCDDVADKQDEDFFQDQGSIDAFFKSDKFIDETEASFLRIRLGSEFQSKEPANFKYKIRAQIPLSRTKKSFQIFVDDVEKNHFATTTTSTEVKDTSTEVGVSFFAPVYKDIKSKYSIGISSLTPYAKARYSKEYNAFGWIIQPSQQFKYSIESDWREETNIYFDKSLETNSIFRTTLYRKTQSHVDGFDYAVAFSYYLTLSKRKGFSISQQFWGNSKYSCEVAPEPYNGISNYFTFASWRQNIFRKWIAIEVQPGISFHRQYEYEPNYVVNFYVDFYFGKLAK